MFIFGLLIVLFAFLAYLYNEQVVSLLPESESYIASYIELIDKIRLELNKLAGKITYLIKKLIQNMHQQTSKLLFAIYFDGLFNQL